MIILVKKAVESKKCIGIFVTLIQVVLVIWDLHIVRPKQVLWLQHQGGIDFGASTKKLV
jgi:hypothetical protein